MREFLLTAPYQFWLFAGLGVASEIVPFVASRFQRRLMPMFVSVCFSFTVFLLWGVGPALLVQTMAVLGAWLRLRLNVTRILAVAVRLDGALAAASLAFHVVGDHPSVNGDTTGRTLVAVIVAVLAWFAANYLLLAADARLRQGAQWREALKAILPYDALSNAALLMLAPSLAEGPGWFVILLVVPLVAIGQMARLSGEFDRSARADPVTGLLSRRALTSDVMDTRVDRHGRLSGGPSYALCMLDLDRFKPVNDALGHETGDRVLATVAQRLKGAVRPGDLVSRYGGDEFIAVAINIDDYDAAATVADRIRVAMAEPMVLEGNVIEVGYSLGVALYPNDGPDLATVIRAADQAMYAAKERGGGVAFYRDVAGGEHSDRSGTDAEPGRPRPHQGPAADGGNPGPFPRGRLSPKRPGHTRAPDG